MGFVWLKELFNTQPVYFSVAGISTFLFVVKLLLLMFAGASKDFDLDLDTSHLEAGKSFSVFSTQAVLGFLMGLGWMGLAASTEWTLGFWLALCVALVFGSFMMLFTAYLAMKMSSLNHVPKFNPWSLVGSQGQAYVPIPPNGQGEGQVELVIGGAKKVVRAVNEGSGEIPSFAPVKVVGIKDKVLLIRKIETKTSEVREYA